MKVNGQDYRTIWADADGQVQVIDQRKLPHEFVVMKIASITEMAEAIRRMAVRGAPLIGASAAWGLALAMREDASDAGLARSSNLLLASRPTAVNLQWAVERMHALLLTLPIPARVVAAQKEAERICDEDAEMNAAIGRAGLALIRQQHDEKQRAINVLTHCNAGWLGTVDWGTALAPIVMAHQAGIPIHVWVDETRPRMQGALTAWELKQAGVPHTVIVDNAGGHLMQHGRVDMVIVGCDRVTAIGDVCNKIGTYLKALAAKHNAVPFYVALPEPTIDWNIESGLTDIQIEDRGADEVLHLVDGAGGKIQPYPLQTQASNPGFDITPAQLVTGYITDVGVLEKIHAGARRHWAPAANF